MPEEQRTEEDPVAVGEINSASLLTELDMIKAELEEEKKARAAAEATMAEKDARIAALEAELNETRKQGEALAKFRDGYSKAVARYLDVLRVANPTIPSEVITGSTIEEIDASLKKAQSIANAVKACLEAQAREAKVPAGAPTRGGIAIEALSPREKIAYGIQQKGLSP